MKKKLAVFCNGSLFRSTELIRQNCLLRPIVQLCSNMEFVYQNDSLAVRSKLSHIILALKFVFTLLLLCSVVQTSGNYFDTDITLFFSTDISVTI